MDGRTAPDPRSAALHPHGVARGSGGLWAVALGVAGQLGRVRRGTQRLLRAEAAVVARQALEQLILSNLRAMVLLACALGAVIAGVATAEVVVVLASPPTARLWVALGCAVAWLLLALGLALAGRARLRLHPSVVLQPLKEDLEWALALLRRVVN